MRKVNFQYLDKRSDNLKNTQFRVEKVFADSLGKESILAGQVNKHKVGLSKMM